MSSERPGEESSAQRSLKEPPFTRLFTRLLVSHSMPVLVVTLALALVLVALIRISVVLTTVSEVELVTLHDEGEVHRAAWVLDVTMRHGQAACARGEPEGGDASANLEARTRALAVLIERVSIPGPMMDVAKGYLAIASEALEGDVCSSLLGVGLQRRRDQLDERLTNLWVERLAELHRAVAVKDEEARWLAVSATAFGIPLALASLALAMIVARRMARLLKEPLASLASMAERVGRGDFQTSVRVEGPMEIMALAEELERMRSQLEQLEALKQGFLASVSHELRTPLSKIREALALLQDGAVGPLDERQARVVRIARTACEREIHMVTTLLDLSRLRAGSPIRLRDGSSIDDVVEGAINDERPEAAAREIELEMVTNGETRPCRLDPDLMRHAVANLIRNAVAVSSRGQTVRVARSFLSGGEAGGSDQVRITVVDRGPGVPVEIQTKLFDAFVTQAVPSAGKNLGIGIGLALAREVARAHRGDLFLKQSSDEGATFEMWLPVDGLPIDEPTAPRSLGLDYQTS